MNFAQFCYGVKRVYNRFETVFVRSSFDTIRWYLELMVKKLKSPKTKFCATIHFLERLEHHTHFF